MKALLLIIQNKKALTDEAVDINTVLVSIIDISRKKKTIHNADSVVDELFWHCIAGENDRRFCMSCEDKIG